MPRSVDGAEDNSNHQRNGDTVRRYRIFPSARLVVFLLLFLGCFARQAANNMMSFSLACMVNASSYVDDRSADGNSSDESTRCNGETRIIHEDFRGTYDWDRQIQSNILAGLSWGSVFFIFVGGWICDRFGVKKLYVAVMAILAATSLLIPVVAKWWIALFVLRCLQGLSMVAGWPVVMVVSNEWFPVSEIGIMQAVSTSGTQLGAFAAMMISGVLCKTVGWRAIFYIFGSVSGVTAIGWLLLFHEKVDQAWYMSTDEKDYIKHTRRLPKASSGPFSVPWRSFFTSLPVWAIFAVNFLNAYFFLFIGQFSPTYYKEVLGIDPTAGGIYTSLPFLAQLVGRNIAGYTIGLAEGRISRTCFIRINTVMASYFPPVLLLVASTFDCHQSGVVVACFTLAYFFFGWIIGSFVLSSQTIAPQYAGTITGFSQTALFASGIVCPYITGALTKHSTPEEWKIAIYVSSAFAFLGGTIFLIFGSGELQPWAKRPVRDKDGPVEEEAGDGASSRPARKRSPFVLQSAQLAYERNRVSSLSESL